MFNVSINKIKKKKYVKSELSCKLLIAIEVINGTNDVAREEIMRKKITINIYFL